MTQTSTPAATAAVILKPLGGGPTHLLSLAPGYGGTEITVCGKRTGSMTDSRADHATCPRCLAA